jgi:formate transporter
MGFKDPKEITETGTTTGVTKSKLRWDKALVGGFLGGAYIAFGGLLAITVSSGLNPETWGRCRPSSPARSSRSASSSL